MFSQVGKEDRAPGIPDAGVVAFHYVLDGRVQVAVAGSPPRPCGAGDLIVVVRNGVHRFGSDLDLDPVQAHTLIQQHGADELAWSDDGDGDEVVSRFVCGYLGTAVHRHPLLDALPGLLVTNMCGRPCAEWVESSFRFAARTHGSQQPGGQEMLARLSELMFVEAVREYIQGMSQRILVFYGSYRSDRMGIRLADYCVRTLQARGVEAELIDARAVGLPMLDRMYKEYPEGQASEAMEALAGKIRGADGFGFVAGEYNWGVQPGLKNLTDHFLRNGSGVRPASSAIQPGAWAARARMPPGTAPLWAWW